MRIILKSVFYKKRFDSKLLQLQLHKGFLINYAIAFSPSIIVNFPLYEILLMDSKYKYISRLYKIKVKILSALYLSCWGVFDIKMCV
jgi:hypothetical protein